MDEDQHGSTLQQLAIWKDKYNRLAEQQAMLLNQNQELEDRLINVVDKIERDKSLLSDEIDHLAERLACATNTIDYMKNECARYKSDCMLAVHLLQCQPSFYSSQHLSSLPAELKEKLCSQSDPHTAIDGSPNRPGANEKKIVHFSTSAMTFPPTAVFVQSNEQIADEAPPDEPDSRHDVRDVFLKKIMLAPEYQTEKLVQCPKCGFAVVKYDRCTQTVGDSYLSNSRSAPHLFAMDDGHESEEEGRKRRSTTTTSGGDLLIDLLLDEDQGSPPEGMTSPASVQQQVRFSASPAVHHHPSPNSDSISNRQRQKGAITTGRQEFMIIPISDDG